MTLHSREQLNEVLFLMGFMVLAIVMIGVS